MSSIGGAGHAGHGGPVEPPVVPDPQPSAPAAPIAPPRSPHDGHGTAGTTDVVVEFSASGEAKAGKPVDLTFTAKDRGGRTLNLATVHEKKMHTIAVSEDLSEFQHIHPESRRGGAYGVSYTPQKAGPHTVFAEMTPDRPGAATEIRRFDLPVAGAASAPVRLAVDLAPKTVDTLKVGLAVEPRTIRAGEPVRFTFELRDPGSGRAPDKLENYLGAPGHAIAVPANRSTLVHAHPLDHETPAAPVATQTGGAVTLPHEPGSVVHGLPTAVRPADATRISFEATLPSPGLYKVWGQFQRDGKVITVPFVVEVGR